MIYKSNRLPTGTWLLKVDDFSLFSSFLRFAIGECSSQFSTTWLLKVVFGCFSLFLLTLGLAFGITPFSQKILEFDVEDDDDDKDACDFWAGMENKGLFSNAVPEKKIECFYVKSKFGAIFGTLKLTQIDFT